MKHRPQSPTPQTARPRTVFTIRDPFTGLATHTFTPGKGKEEIR